MPCLLASRSCSSIAGALTRADVAVEPASSKVRVGFAVCKILTTSEREDITPYPDDPREQLELELRAAKRYLGVYLRLSEDNQASEAHRNIVDRFSKELWAIENSKLEARAKAKAQAEPKAEREPKPEASVLTETGRSSNLDASVGAGLGDSLAPGEKSEEERNDEGEIDERPDPTAEEISYLKRRGFPLNPVCQNCERQFDEDDNFRSGCCRYHSGLLKADLEHPDSYWADTDFVEEHEYSSEHPPDVFKWTCCEGDARADACHSTYHIESLESEKARDIPVNLAAAVHTGRLDRPTLDEKPEENIDEKPKEEKMPGPITSEIPRLKRKGYTLNPICSHCERQFDEDENPKGCCKYHSGSLEPETGHEYWDDCDFPEETDYDGEEPDAFEWTCCAGNAEAEACKSGAHTESNASKKARLGST